MLLTALISAMALSLQFPDPGTFESPDWKPEFTPPQEVKLGETVAFFTHASRHFDPLAVTKPAVERVTATMKSRKWTTIYLHDKYNSSNPAWMYLYRDWSPTAYVGSDVGHINMDFSKVRHVVSLGGYFGQCQRSTMTDAIRCWRRDAPRSDFRVTQVVDGIFCVNEFMEFRDPYYQKVRDYFYGTLRKRHPKAVIPVSHTLERIETHDQQVDFLCRQLPPVPSEVNVILDLDGRCETVQVSRLKNAATLVLAWRTSTDLLKAERPEVAPDDVVRRRLKRGLSRMGPMPRR